MNLEKFKVSLTRHETEEVETEETGPFQRVENRTVNRLPHTGRTYIRYQWPKKAIISAVALRAVYRVTDGKNRGVTSLDDKI